jgi:hypothetical protein
MREHGAGLATPANIFKYMVAAIPMGRRPGARKTQAAWRHGHFGPKSAPVTAISDRERK